MFPKLSSIFKKHLQRTIRTFSNDSQDEFKTNLLSWSTQFATAIWLDSNKYQQQYSCFDAALAVDDFTAIKPDYSNACHKLK